MWPKWTLPPLFLFLFSPALSILLVLATVGFFLANVAARAFAGTDELNAGVGVCLLLSVALTVVSLVARRFVVGLLYAIPVVLFFTVPHRFIVELHWLAAMKNFEMKRECFEHCAEKARPTDGGKIAVCEVHDFMMGAYTEAIIYDSSGQIALPEKSKAAYAADPLSALRRV